VIQLRHIPREAKPDFPICNALGGGILDWRILDFKFEELRFQDEADFDAYLVDNLLLDEDMLAQVSRSQSIKHGLFLRMPTSTCGTF
jgi:hypothetical protein